MFQYIPGYVTSGDIIELSGEIHDCTVKPPRSRQAHVLQMRFGENIQSIVITMVSPMSSHDYELRQKSSGKRIFNQIKKKMIMNDKSEKFSEYFEKKQFFNEMSSDVLIDNIITIKIVVIIDIDGMI